MKKKKLSARSFLTTFQLIIVLTTCFVPRLVCCQHFIATSDIWTPFFMVSEKQYTGIGVEILTEIVRRTGDTVYIQYFSNKRAMVMFNRKRVDMMILDSPQWSNADKDNYIFTNSFMSVQEYIYSLAKHDIKINKIEDLAGKTVDIMRGYYYPMFEKAFADQVVIKEEVDAEQTLIEKLVARRSDAIFMDSIAFELSIAKAGYAPGLFKRGLKLSDAPLGIKLRKEHVGVLPRFNKAIAQMLEDGTIDTIIKKYLRSR